MRNWIYAVIIAGLVVALSVISYRGGRESFERDLVFGIASKSYQKVGKFVLMPTRDGATMISFDPKPFTYAGAGADAKQGGKK